MQESGIMIGIQESSKVSLMVYCSSS